MNTSSEPAERDAERKDIALAEWSVLILFNNEPFILTNFGKRPLHNRDRQAMLHTDRCGDTRESSLECQAVRFQLEQYVSTVIEWWQEGNESLINME